MPLAMLAIFAGYLLVNAALKGEHPWCEVLRAFGGSCPPPPGRSAAGELQPGAPSDRPPATTPSELGTGSTTARAQAFSSEVFERFPTARSLGIFVCKKIAGSDTWSEHSWGNALDIGGSQRVLGQVAAWAGANRVRFAIRNILWQVPGHDTHVHVDFEPSHAGSVPSCAN